MTVLADRSPNRLGRVHTLGVITDWIGDSYQGGLLTGVLDAAKSAGTNLLCFVGGSIPTDPQSNGRHRTFELIREHNVNGLVLFTSTLMHRVGKDGMTEYCRSHFQRLPLCSIGSKLDGIPSITTGNQEGIRATVSHLVREHGCQRIAFVRGPMANEEAQSRFDAYLAALKEHDLEVDERLVALGDFMPPSGRAAVRQFSQIRGMRLTDIGAMVASNDEMAIGVLRGLKESGVSVPTEVAVTGFDDSDEASLMSPPLTTVRQPLVKIGRQAARNVIEWIQGSIAPEDSVIATQIVVRRSCGCAGHAASTAGSIAPKLGYGFDAALVMRRQHILDKLTRVARGEFGVAGKDWPARLLTAFAAELRAETPHAFRHMLEDFAEKLAARGTDIQSCHDVVDCLRQQLSVTLYSEPERRNQVEDIFYQTHLAISEILRRGLMRSRLELGRSVREISSACNRLSSVDNLAELRACINGELPHIGLGDYFVVIYRNGDARHAEVLVAREQGREIELRTEAPFEASDLLPRELLPYIGGGKAFAVMPLACKSEMLGHALFALDLERIFAFDELAIAIGAGIRSARFAEDTQAHQACG